MKETGSKGDSIWTMHGNLILIFELPVLYHDMQDRLLSAHRWQRHKIMHSVWSCFGYGPCMNDAHTQMHGRDSAHDLSVKLSPCLCSCPGWKMAAFSLCMVTCMVCVPQPTTKSRVCCSLNTILHFCSIWIWSSLVCVVLVCEGWMAQTYFGKTVGKDGSIYESEDPPNTVYNSLRS